MHTSKALPGPLATFLHPQKPKFTSPGRESPVRASRAYQRRRHAAQTLPGAAGVSWDFWDVQRTVWDTRSPSPSRGRASAHTEHLSHPSSSSSRSSPILDRVGPILTGQDRPQSVQKHRILGSSKAWLGAETPGCTRQRRVQRLRPACSHRGG